MANFILQSKMKLILVVTKTNLLRTQGEVDNLAKLWTRVKKELDIEGLYFLDDKFSEGLMNEIEKSVQSEVKDWKGLNAKQLERLSGYFDYKI